MGRNFLGYSSRLPNAAPWRRHNEGVRGIGGGSHGEGAEYCGGVGPAFSPARAETVYQILWVAGAVMTIAWGLVIWGTARADTTPAARGSSQALRAEAQWGQIG